MTFRRLSSNFADETKWLSSSMGHFLYLERRPPLVTVDLSTGRGYWLVERRAYLTVENAGCCLQLISVVYRGHQWFFPKSASPTTANTIVRSRSGWTGWRDAHPSVRDLQDWSIIVLSGRRLDGWLPSRQILLSSQNSRGRLPISRCFALTALYKMGELGEAD